MGREPAEKVTGLENDAFPVKDKACPVKELVNSEIVMLDVTKFSSLMIRTSDGVIAVTAGSSLTFILAISSGITSVVFSL